MGFVILGAIVVSVALFAFGISSVPRSGTSNLGNDNIEGCKAACDNLLAKRQQVCSHRADVAAATAFQKTAFLEWAAAVATSLAAAGLVAVAAGVPIIGPFLAAAAGVVAAAAVVYANYLFGRLMGANLAVTTQNKGLADATKLEAEATTLVTNSCPSDEATRCIGSLPACPV
jgi:hypothetical protein